MRTPAGSAADGHQRHAAPLDAGAVPPAQCQNAGERGAPHPPVRPAPREAQLAIALNEGQSIAEAAENMGLTLETARNYSKRLYAKLGVRGQAELVRLVSDSVAVMG
ncbi:helix-turn-helix transcriptional regulator [Novosphingobium resinovorum]